MKPGRSVLLNIVSLLFWVTGSAQPGLHLFPVVHALRGSQLGEDYRIMAGIQFLFF